MKYNKRILFAGVTEGTGVLISVTMPISSSAQSKMHIYKQKPETLQWILQILYDLDTTGIGDTSINRGCSFVFTFCWLLVIYCLGLTWKFKWCHVLGLVGMELIFFVAAPMVVLWIRFVTKTVFQLLLNSACTALRPSLFLTLPLSQARGEHSRDSWPQLTKRILCNTWCSAQQNSLKQLLPGNWQASACCWWMSIFASLVIFHSLNCLYIDSLPYFLAYACSVPFPILLWRLSCWPGSIHHTPWLS